MEIIVEGNLGSDPELKFAKDESLAEFSFAYTPYSKTKGEGETVWLRVTFWNSKSDLVMDSLKKGDKILLHGIFKQRTYEAKDGSTKISNEVTGKSFGIVPKSPKNQAPFVASVHEAEAPAW